MKLPPTQDPTFEVTLPDGTVRSYEPWVIADRLVETMKGVKTYRQTFDAIRRVLGFPTAAAVAGSPAPRPFTLTAGQCVQVHQALWDFMAEIDDDRKSIKPFAELLHFFPGLSLADVTAMSNVDRLLWLRHKRRIQAREHLDLASVVGSVFSTEKNSVQRYQVQLAETAFGDDERELATALEAMTRQ
jgi:hypothetical protein